MTELVIISCALAALGFFAWHIVDRVTDEKRKKRIAEEIEKVSKEIRDALENGNVARACQLRKRLLELMAE